MRVIARSHHHESHARSHYHESHHHESHHHESHHHESHHRESHCKCKRQVQGVMRVIASSRDPLRGSAWSRRKNSIFFLRFCFGSRDPLRGSAWSRCNKPPGCFGVFCGARATLCRDRRGRAAKSRGFFSRFLRCSRDELSRGSRACSQDRRVAGSMPPFPPGARAGFASESRNSQVQVVCEVHPPQLELENRKF